MQITITKDVGNITTVGDNHRYKHRVVFETEDETIKALNKMKEALG